MAARLAKAKDVETVPQLPPRLDDRPRRRAEIHQERDRFKATIAADLRKALAACSSQPEKTSSNQDYDCQALERNVPNRPTTPSPQYVHAVSHQVQGYAVKEQTARAQLTDSHKPQAQLPSTGWKTCTSMPRSTMSLINTEATPAPGILFIRVVSIKEFLLSVPSTHTMISVRVDTGRERVDTDFVAIGKAEMLLGQEFCVPVFEDTTLTLTVHLMQAPHLFDDDDDVSAENFRLLTNLMHGSSPTASLFSVSPSPSRSCTSVTQATSSSTPSTPSTFGTIGEREGGGRGRLGRLLHRKLRSKRSDKSNDSQTLRSNCSTASSASPSSSVQYTDGRGTPSTVTSSLSDTPQRDPATIALCQHALFDDELCIAKSAVRFRDLRHACENEVTIADFEAFNNWYGPNVDRKNKTGEDFSMLDDDDSPEHTKHASPSQQREEATMVAKISTKVCFIPGIALEPEDALLDRSEDPMVDEHGEPVSREPYNLRECAQAERYFAWNKRHICEGKLFYMAEDSRIWRRETFTMIGCKIWMRQDGDKSTEDTDSTQEQPGQRQRDIEEAGRYLELEDLDRVQTVRGSYSASPLFALPNQVKMVEESTYDAQDTQDELGASSFLPLKNGFRLWFKNGFTQDFYADDEKDAEEWVSLILEVCRGRPPRPTWL
ncbi:hypothetical protein BGZ73_006101 [Actinomortierella ambigua]|nr:hypothetical protein BGZ73_006101 [Actinomortierella ambigua]